MTVESVQWWRSQSIMPSAFTVGILQNSVRLHTSVWTHFHAGLILESIFSLPILLLSFSQIDRQMLH